MRSVFRFLLPALLAVAAMSACSSSDTASDDASGTSVESALQPGSGRDQVNAPGVTIQAMAPASYSGTLPCADCPGISATLSVWPDSIYRLRYVYQERIVAPFISTGRWHVDNRELVLEGESDQPQRWAMLGADSLRMLDMDGNAIESDLPYSLTRLDSLDNIADVGNFVGTFIYMADAATFRECASGRTVPVLMRGDYLALERAYTRSKLPPGSGQQVQVEGRFLPRPADMEGREREVFEVRRYIGPSANLNCR